MSSEDLTIAVANRSLRTIKAELEFLTDASILTPQQLESLLDQLPGPVPMKAPVTTAPPRSPLPTPNTSNLTVNEKQANGRLVNSQSQQPPPAYPVAPAPPNTTALTYAVALYTYTPTDTGDLALAPQERVAVTEYMNAEWWKGRSEKTGQEGIFPRSYVKVEDTKTKAANAPPRTGSNYGNMPLEVSQSGGDAGSSSQPSKHSENGKKIGKKVGNAALFGAGATLGGKVVNAIF